MRVDRDVELKWENMRRGIDSQGSWLRTGPRRLYEQARDQLTGPAPSRIFLVGCGDSHYCGLAARLAFEEWSGIPTEALESLEFSRYAGRYAPVGSWVVCVSNSGRVARTVECALLARSRDLVPVAVTFSPDSRLAQEAAATLRFQYEDVGFGPGTLSYTASLSALLALAVHAGELAGRVDQQAAERHLAALEARAQMVEETIAASEPVARQLAESIAEGDQIQILGGGPNYGTALFGMAKLIEAAAVSAVGQELEEWAHEQYFCTGPGTFTFVLAPPGAATDRAREQLAAIRDMEATPIAICDPADAATTSLAEHVLPVVGDGEEALSPITYSVPLQLFSYHYAVTKGKTMLGFDNARRMEVNFRQIFGSQVVGSR
jgi:glucosamine--fructose-6-phosphate aminotransferase (isomerizing)